jgi:hypothetical protein
MITIIDTETKKGFVFERYTDAAKKLNMPANTLRNWGKTKFAMNQRPWEVTDKFEIYYDCTLVKAKTGFALNPLIKF